MKYITGDVYAFDVLETPPPFNTKINLITKHGIQIIGVCNKSDVHHYIAWYPLLKIPKTVKERWNLEHGIQSA